MVFRQHFLSLQAKREQVLEIDDTYTTLEQAGEGLYKEKGSKFIASAFVVESEDDVKAALVESKKKYHDARHHCYAYIIGADKSISRSNDDGEPAGTAGKPILNQILSKNVTNTCVIVVRYFGGTKLGVSGLINAYKTASREALDNAGIVNKIINICYTIDFPYSVTNEVSRVLKEIGVEQTKSVYDTACHIEFSTRKKNAGKIEERFSVIKEVVLNQVKTL